MPESCAKCDVGEYNGYCRISEYLDEFGIERSREVECDKAHADYYNRRADFCPLLDVPPHGRLVDADALLRGERFLMEYELEDCSHVKQEIVFASSIQRAQTVIPAEEVQT